MHRLIALAIVSLITLASCDTGSPGACTEIREAADPASFLHVIDPASAQFLTDPPTSGPHVSGALPTGVLDEAIEPAIQVSILESGSALIQYGPDLTADELETVLSLSGPDVVIAPGDNLPSRIVATAWTWKLTCSSPDATALSDFVDRRRSDAPGRD